MPNPVTMPFAAILPSGPASNMAGGSHCSGPVTAGVVSGAGGAGCSAGAVDAVGAVDEVDTAVDAAAAGAALCAVAAAEMVITIRPTKLICKREDERIFIPSHQLSP